MLPYAAYWILRVNLLIWASLKVTGAVSTGYSFRIAKQFMSINMQLPGTGVRVEYAKATVIDNGNLVRVYNTI